MTHNKGHGIPIIPSNSTSRSYTARHPKLGLALPEKSALGPSRAKYRFGGQRTVPTSLIVLIGLSRAWIIARCLQSFGRTRSRIQLM